jgi:drug/metabolite transporter (DMT)-like permease
MTRRKVFILLASAAGYIGIGMLLAYGFTNHDNNTPLWLGALLVVAGALLLGMYISARGDTKADAPAERPASSSGNITDLPPQQK